MVEIQCDSRKSCAGDDLRNNMSHDNDVCASYFGFSNNGHFSFDCCLDMTFTKRRNTINSFIYPVYLYNIENMR